MSLSRTDLARMLSLGSVTVTFTKVDGTERIMECTIAPHLIPEDNRPIRSGELLTEVPTESDQMRVFDLNVGDWRSFRVSSVKEVTLVREPSDSRYLAE
jgi:hypothetical protein